ncbi:hypothetical protein JY651_30205 [Pyxidicoccus parkwayensis]|uniref:Tubulin like n=1 Tax=Pyxidicoccus parkwayensis TaxID=2813578 RepID=A0ABX7NL43_9BACT|nr:tubulin-like doman-containing protein [Pyxidicoccus parkwaysis]QSQ19575.1 hypothetical protein JY651_30205 [Pyxidicoccus parkwaysis]
MGLLATEKFNPTLFVGLGGNGGKIVQLLAQRLRRHPNWERIQSMTHFVVIDTNKDDLDKLRDVPPENRFLISAFDQRAYIERKRGQRELPEDPLVTQWVPASYGFRAAQGAGAGQIRMESRLRLYYNLEEDRRGIRRTLQRLLDESTRRENPWRDNENKVVRVMLYGSVAGGTGSGGFLPMAYLLRQMVQDAGWGRPQIVSMLTLPTAFREKVRPQLQADIMANGYAALKELEFLNRQLDYAGGTDSLEFHYDPGTRDTSRQFVGERPFALTYLIDRPDQISIEKYEHAVADACYVQLFSPLLGAQAGEYDNYEKHQKKLALGHFSVHYGAFGTALLQLPRRDILRYAGLRYVASAFRQFLCFGADHPDFQVPYGDPAFQRLDVLEKNRRIDEKFKGYVAFRAGEEERRDEKGQFFGIQAQLGKGGRPMADAFRARLEEVFGRLDERIDIPDVEKQSINPGNPSLSRPIAVLRRSKDESRARVVGEYLEAQRGEVRIGRFFETFFKDNEVNPIAQRLFLIRLLEQPFLVPFQDPEDGAYLKSDVAPPDLDSPEVRQEISRLDAEMARNAQPGLLKSLTDRDNKAFSAAKLRAVSRVEQWSNDFRDEIKRTFWRAFESELRKDAEARLESFRKVAQVADERARDAEAQAERFRKDPAAVDTGSDVAQFYLDAEVLRDDRRRERLWRELYLHKLDSDSNFRASDIFDAVTEAFSPARDSDGRLRARDAGEIVQKVRERLEAQATEVYGRVLKDMGLDLASALELEQRYVALHRAGKDLEALKRTGKLDEELRAVPARDVRTGIEDRFKRLAEECVLLAHVDATRRDDPTVVPADVFYAGLHERYASDEEGALWNLLRGSVAGTQRVAGWEEQDSLVLYRALLGVPLYWFRNIQTELYSAYKKVKADTNRTYPLHIEAAWEGDPGLPDLDPVEIKRAEERRTAERAAQAARQSRDSRLRAFTLCMLFGNIVRDEQGYHWTFAGTRNKLAPERAQAFEAFEAMDPTLRSDLESSSQDAWRHRTVERSERTRLLEEAQAHQRKLTETYARAVAEGRDAEKRFLQEERAVVESLLAELRA